MTNTEKYRENFYKQRIAIQETKEKPDEIFGFFFTTLFILFPKHGADCH